MVVQRLDENGLVRRFETVERPTEGTIFEALFQLREIDGGVIYVDSRSVKTSFHEEDLALFQAIANVATSAIVVMRGRAAAEAVRPRTSTRCFKSHGRRRRTQRPTIRHGYDRSAR